VQYEGQWYVHAKGVRNKTIPASNVEKLVQRLRNEDFFDWEEKKTVCLDFPRVNITVTMDGGHKNVLEGCNEPGKILALADESTGTQARSNGLDRRADLRQKEHAIAAC
jgi:hypothetical protein